MSQEQQEHMSEPTDLVAQQALRATRQVLAPINPQAIERVLALLQEGNTVPFIARYRKEVTGGLDEVAIRDIETTYQYQVQLAQRKSDVQRLIAEQDKLTPDLQKAIANAQKMQQLEDLYRPFKQKRRTKATIAREIGLEPLANWLLQQPQSGITEEAARYCHPHGPCATIAEALEAAHEIMAERIGDAAEHRAFVRRQLQQKGHIQVRVKNSEADEKGVYEGYYEFDQPLAKMVPHRTLAINRGEKEGILKVSIVLDETEVFIYFTKQLVTRPHTSARSAIEAAYEDAYRRFIFPSVAREVRNELTDTAQTQAIQVFGDNVRQLLLQPPMKQQIILGLDPAYRTGCKWAVIDETGKVGGKGVIYPHPPASQEKRQQAKQQFQQLLKQYQVTLVAIGNGTASRESEQFVAEQIKQVAHQVHYVLVSEAGASVYSASDLAREEFPDYQVEERSAVSIARRLQDPLAELVKIDPKAIGVGQYQHDVAQKQLSDQLDFVVETAVNQVGVNLNTASVALLQHVSGLNKTIAHNIVQYREANGRFSSRQQLKKVPRLGPKAFEQSVGFLRIVGGEHPFDNTGIHPESYAAADTILQAAHVSLNELGEASANERIKRLSQTALQQQTGLGMATLRDVLDGLLKPGRDLREQISSPLLRQDVVQLADLQPGMMLQGTVRNVVDFGAFVDIGVKQDGLVHLSKLAEKFVQHPSDIVSVGDIVTVWVDGVDVAKGRISLTMCDPDAARKTKNKRN